MKTIVALTAVLTTTTLFAGTIKVDDCTVGSLKARCGTYTTEEKAGKPKTIDVKFVVLPATEKNTSAVVLMQGDPGQAVIEDAQSLAATYAALRPHHDLLLIDERGAGTSAPLACDAALKKYRWKQIGVELFPTDLIKDCRAEIEARGTDVSAYTYPYFADDVDGIRTALGYGSVDILATSYSTRAALTFLERHPKAVRSMLLYAPVAPSEHPPLDYGRDGQEALLKLVAACDDDEVCHGFEQKFGYATALLPTQLQLRPRQWYYHDPVDRVRYAINFTRGAYGDWLLAQLKSTKASAELPHLFHYYYQTDIRELAKSFFDYRNDLYDGLGLYMTVTCMSDVRSLTRDAVTAATKDNFLTNHRGHHHIEACEQWTPGSVPAVKIPSKADVPLLLVTGAVDPISPKRSADAIAKSAKRAKTIVLANTAHAELNPCFTSIAASFIEAGSFAKLDDSCAKTIKRPPFDVTPK